MLKARFDVSELTRRTGEIARLVPADELFAWLSRSITIPAGWIALASRSELDPLLLVTGQRCPPDELLDVLFVRDTPIEVTVSEDRLTSSDGFPVSGQITVRVRVIPEPAELAAFRRSVLGSTTTLVDSGLQRQFAWPLGRVLAELASAHTAARLLEGPDDEVVTRLVKDQLGPTLLAGGLTLEGVPSVVFESSAFHQHVVQQNELRLRQERANARAQIQRALAEAQRDHLDHLTRLLEQMRELSAQSGHATLRDLLASFSEVDRAQLYGALWHAMEPVQRTAFIAVASGRQVLLFAPDDLRRPARQITVPETLGPLRSVTMDAGCCRKGLLLLGACTGVHVVDLASGEVQVSLAAPHSAGQTVAGGFNRAAMHGTSVLATHSELGAVHWEVEGNNPIRARNLLKEATTGAQCVRGATIAHGRFWLAIDDTVWSTAPDGAGEAVAYRGSTAVVSALRITGGRVLAGNVSGELLSWEIGSPEEPEILRGSSGRPIESIDLLEYSGIERLVIADRSRELTVMVPGEHYERPYASGGPSVRRAVAADDCFAAMNDARDRLIVWDTRQPAAPLATIIIPHLTGEPIQDLALIPA